MNSLTSILYSVVNFYEILIIIYVLMSWFPLKGFFAEIYSVLASVCEPFLSLFRRFIPPIGGTLDISPIVAIFALNLLLRLIVGAL